ncbi:hypothetical protein FJZ28_00775 [Candidatus Peregrinibacteria bacterium]|nr:hypothetical protein [Candidatus Peregrinibacteria bacterium]
MPRLRDIVGHEKQMQSLAQDIAQGNVAHAYLFSGVPHLGKMSVALRFAADLLMIDANAAEKKSIQRQIEHLTHPDLLVLDQLWMEEACEDWGVIAKTSNAPQVHRSKKPAAKTDTISIDDIRALQEILYGTAMGRYRCCIIRSIERMQEAAASAFLKILEEPPEYLIFLLTTQDLEVLLPTIVSRTRVLAFHPLPSRSLQPLLDEVDEDDARFILHLSRGAPGTAISLASDPDLLRTHRTVHGTAQSFWRASQDLERMKLLVPIHERGSEADMLLLHLGLILRERMPANVACVRAYSELARDLESNAHRQLLVQRFALSVGQSLR